MLQRIGRFRRSRKALLWVGAVVGLLVLATVAFAAGQSSRSASGRSSGASAPSPMGVPALSDSGGTAERAAPGVAPSAPAPAQGDPVTGDRALVRSVEITLEAPDPGVAVAQVRASVVAAGGYVAQEQTRSRGSSLVLRVPAGALDRLVTDVGGLGHVTSQRSQVSDVTDQVVDLDARVASQQASVDRVRALLARAESIGDVVSVEGELARREADLDALKNRLAALRGKAALSTVTLDISQTGDDPVVAPADAPTFLGGLAAGWDGLRALGGVAGAVLGFVIPFLPVVAVLLGVGWLVRRRVRSGRGGPSAEGNS